MQLPCFIDFEASSLGIDSYPTEVAWSTPDGVIESHLINPYHVEEWTDWDPAAQAITGISRRLLREQGRPPEWVCRRMNEALAGLTLYSDAVQFDGFWLGSLFEQSRCGPPAFRLGDLFLMVLRTTGLPRQRVVHCLEAGRVEVGKAHRAAWDVQAHLAGWRLAAGRGGT
ncbi:MAG: hypothetical protein D6786_07205 [Gammaproteobacteria bacterium]|nr:MAG: hypothetical protein D6786_07205 [Gammaproteobacteria bacterium]